MVVLRCVSGCGRKIGVSETRYARGDAGYREGIDRIMLRFGVSTLRELQGVYTCRSCRRGRVRRNISTPRIEPQPQLQLVTPSAVKKLKLIGQGQDIDINKYNNFYVGFEFEFEENRDGVLRDVITKFNLREGKTGGLAKVVKQIRLADGSNIDIPIQDDLYKNEQVVTQVYVDGSVGLEVTTRPLHFKNLEKAKEVFEYCKSKGEMKSPKAGLHMTFLLDWHKNLSMFDELVVKNLIQMIRSYYQPLVYMFQQSSRGTAYRIINPYTSLQNLRNCQHHHAVCPRFDNNGTIWALEIRLPDGTDTWEVVKKQVLFYSALIRHCATLSQKGLLYLEQTQWDTQQQFSTNMNSRLTGEPDLATQELQIDLLSRLANDVEALSNRVTSIDEMYEHEEQNLERLRMAQMSAQR